MKPPSGTRRAGSALLIVLGLLAVLMMLGLTFSVFARTEHAGSTNLKNGAVARQSLQTAVGHVMEAIDLSFGSPSNNWPVCVWPQAWLASSELEVQDYYQSEILGDGEVPAAQILTDDAAKFLSPSQLALAKSAAVGWAPIYAAIDSEGPRTDAGGGLFGNKGRDNADSVIGRYAFIALETTGLLDANAAGSVNGTDGGDSRANNTGDNPFTYILPQANDKAKFENVKDLGDYNYETETVEIPHTIKNRSTFVSARDGTTQLSSFADLRAIAGAALDEAKPAKPSSNAATDCAAKPFPADLFNTFYASLADLDPDGQPKVAFPAGSGEQDIRRFAARAFPAMVKVFANARADTSTAGGAALNPSSNEGDQFTFFEGSGKEYSLTRARLATIAAIDAQDNDFVPCKSTAANNYSALQRLPNLNSFKVNVVNASGDASVATVSDTLPSSIKNGSSLNLPCTENVPMLQSVFVWIGFNPNPIGMGEETVNGIPTPYIDFGGGVQLYAVASAQGDGPKPGSATLSVECEFLSSKPKSGTTTGVATTDNITKMIWDKSAAQPHSVWTCNAFDDFAPAGHVSKTVSFSGSGGSTVTAKKDDIEFKVRCYAAVWPGMPQNAPQPPANTKQVLSYQGAYFYPPTLAQERELGDLFLPFRFKAEIKVDGTVVQQVPAPAIDADGSYRVRADAALYHQKNSPLVSPSPTQQDWYPGQFQLAPGWAACLEPAFGFDTTSLRASGDDMILGGEGMNVWVNNVAVYSNAGGNKQMWTDVATYMADPAHVQAFTRTYDGGLNWLQFNWLFEDKYNLEPVTSWLLRGCPFRPDLLHSDAIPNEGGQPFYWQNGKGSQSKLLKGMSLKVPNVPFESVGQLGNVRIGPYETLSTVRAYRYGTSVTDFHRVLDYFSATEDRSDPPSVNTSTGEVDYSNSGELFSGIARGRVNLNMPPLVRWNSKKGIRATTDGMLPNPYPVIAAMQGATPSLNFSLASKIATRIGSTAGEEVKNTKGFRKPDGSDKTVEKTVVRRLSEIGWAEINGRNPILTDIIQSSRSAADSDEDREAYIGQCANAFTTRGQTFLVIVRADAYTPRYGEEASTGDGTTLATTHAVLELFRDPEYARYPDGTPLEDENGNPVFFHNWFIKSFHVL